MARSDSTPFLRRRLTCQYIDDISQVDRLVVYAGAGVTIDRTGMGWADLVERLLEPHVENDRLRKHLVQLHGAHRAASIAAQLYMDRYEAEVEGAPGDASGPHRRMVDQLRPMLYGGARWGGGRLAAEISQLAVLKRAKDETCCMVTPNYEDYLVQDLKAASTELAKSGPRVAVRESVLHWCEPPAEASSAGEGLDLFGEPGEAVCHLLHGYLPRDGTCYRPVISEQDYFDSEEQTTLRLERLFSGSNVLIVGSSMADPPLLKALLKTRGDFEATDERRRNRYWLHALQGDAETPEELETRSVLNYSRAGVEHFGVIPIYADYHIELAQFVQEVKAAMAARFTPLGQVPYGDRLDWWWSNWWKEEDRERLQWTHHRCLEGELCAARDLLQADEELKAELWVAWDPCNTRTLRLWASSIGPTTDHGLMYQADVDRSAARRHPIVKTYCSGQTLCTDGKEHSRWRTYLATPVWVNLTAAGYGRRRLPAGELPVGVVALASMRDRHESVISDRNRLKLMAALNLLKRVARQILQTPP